MDTVPPLVPEEKRKFTRGEEIRPEKRQTPPPSALVACPKGRHNTLKHTLYKAHSSLIFYLYWVCGYALNSPDCFLCIFWILFITVSSRGFMLFYIIHKKTLLFTEDSSTNDRHFQKDYLFFISFTRFSIFFLVYRIAQSLHK